MIFRRLTPKDAGAMAQVHADGFTTPWSEYDFRTFMQAPSYVALGVEDGDELLAFALFQVIPPEIELCTLVVAKSSRRRGLGKSLLNTCLSEVLEGDVCFLEVAENNEAALRLYRELGFTTIGIREKYYKNTQDNYISAIQMRKWL